MEGSTPFERAVPSIPKLKFIVSEADAIVSNIPSDGQSSGGTDKTNSCRYFHGGHPIDQRGGGQNEAVDDLVLFLQKIIKDSTPVSSVFRFSTTPRMPSVAGINVFLFFF